MIPRLRLPVISLLFVYTSTAVLAQSKRPRAIVLELENLTQQPRQLVSSIATETLSNELNRREIFEVVSSQEVQRAAKARNLSGAVNVLESNRLARELEAPLVVSGEVRSSAIERRDGRRYARVVVVARVRSVPLDEDVCSAAEVGVSFDEENGKKPDGLILMDAAVAAANRLADRFRNWEPATGQVLNSAGHDIVVLNRGLSHGIHPKQEFAIVRRGVKIGKAKVFKVLASYTELKLLDSNLGVQPQDTAIALASEPKLPR